MPPIVLPHMGVRKPSAGQNPYFNDMDATLQRLDDVAAWHPEAQGAVGDGVTLDTTAIVNTLALIGTAGGGTLWLTKGKTYLVAANTLNAVSNLTVAGGGKLKTTSTAVDGAIFTATSVSNVTFADLEVEAPDDRTYFAHLVSSTDVTFARVRCIKACLYATNLALTYATADTNGGISTGGNVCRRVYSFGCSGEGMGAANVLTARAFIFMHYVVGGASIGDHAYGYASGIQWWGGDANPGGNGAIVNERKCGKFSVSGHDFRDMPIGGVWGSMGRDITVGVGHVENIGDLGYDCEGGLNVSFVGSSAKNCNNGCGTFWYNRNVLFDIIVETDFLDGYLFQIKNAGQSRDNQDITVRGSFTCTNGIGLIGAEVANNVTMDITTTDALIFANSNNMGDVTIKAKMRFTRARAALFSAINVGQTHNRHVNLDVEIYTEVAQPAGSRAITVGQVVYAHNNIRFDVRGWGATPITIDSLGNTGSNPMTHLYGNLGEGTGIERIEGANKSVLWWDRVWNVSLYPFLPITTPVAGYWDYGQLAADGKRCTVSGSPGTWV